MHRPIFGHSFAVLVAPILLSVLAFNFLKKKKTSVRKNVKDADAATSGSLTAPKETDSDGSSLFPTKTNNGASCSSTTSTGNYYEVFLNFRGQDTRRGFTDHLYNGLVDAGISVFKDDNELRQGEKIGPDLLTAIKNSKILIPIISVNYGQSRWCLDELVQIMECKKSNMGYTVLPIFYKVEPSHVRFQSGSFRDAFRTCSKHFDSMTLEKWKQALNEVSSLKGFDANGYEGKLVKLVVQQVLFELKKKFELVIPENLVGIDNHVKKVMEFVDNISRASLFIGIHGMGGIGKTTLAKIIYNKLSNQFEHRSFIADVRETCDDRRLVYLQYQLIKDILKQENQVSNKDEGIQVISSKLNDKKVLILLDDVSNDDQLKALAGNHNWFSSGSVIIITTRNKSILDNAGVDNQYELEELDKDNSLILFSRHAFRRDSPPSEFKDLTHVIVSTTGGLPLSLKVLGSFLCGKKEKVWGDTIKKLRKFPHEEVQKKLRISYEELTNEQKQIFLDIACFFIGVDQRIASYMWDACEFFPEEGIEVLRFLSLIKVGDDHKLIMHDQLRDLGREIVRKENNSEPWNRSRLWDSEVALEVLEGNKGTTKIEAFRLGLSYGSGSCTTETFKELTNLRFLQLDDVNLIGDFQNLLPRLRWLVWDGYHLDFELTNFHLKKLVVLNLLGSEISNDWAGFGPLKMATELKVLNLSDCALRTTPDLSTFKGLEILMLEHCYGLEEIHPAIKDIKTLVSLNVNYCCNLKELPREVGRMEELRELLIQNTGIEELPESMGSLKKLEILDASYCESLACIPNSIGNSTSLSCLDLTECHKLAQLPDSIGSLVSLSRLLLSGCHSLRQIPDSIGKLKSLTELHLKSTAIEELPESIGPLKELKTLDASYCKSLARIPNSIGNSTSLSCLDLTECHKLAQLPDSIGSLVSLPWLLLSGCHSLRQIPDSIGKLTSLTELHLKSTAIEELPESIGSLKELKTLDASYCKSLARIPDSIGNSTSLSCLDLTECHKLSQLPDSIGSLVSLHRLLLSGCHSLRQIPDSIGKLTSLTEMHLKSTAIEDLPKSVSFFKVLKTLNVFPYPSLAYSPNPLGNSTSLSCLVLTELDKLAQLPNSIGSLVSLQGILLSRCHSLRQIPYSIGKLTSLTELHLKFTAIEELPESIGSLKELKTLDASYCESLARIPKSIVLLKHPKTLTADNSAMDYQTTDFEHVLERSRPFGIFDEVNNLPVNILPVSYNCSSLGQSSYSSNDLPINVVITLSQGSLVKSMDFHQVKQILLLVGTNMGDVMVWEVGNGVRNALRKFKIWDLGTCSMALQASLANDYTASVNRVMWSPDGILFGVAYSKHMVHIYSYHGGDDMRNHLEIEAHVGSVNDLAFLNPSKKLCFVTCGEDKTIKVWDAVTGAKLLAFEGHEAPVYSICPHNIENIQYIFSTATDGKIKGWLYDNMVSRVNWDAPGHSSTVMAYNADGTRLFSCGTNKEGESYLVEWNESEGAIKRTYHGLGKRSSGVVQFDTTKNRFLAIGDEFTVKFWDMDNNNILISADADGGLPASPCIRFNKEGNLLAVSTSDNSIKILANADGIRLLRIVDNWPFDASRITPGPLMKDSENMANVKLGIADDSGDKSRNWKPTEINEPSQCRSIRLPDNSTAARVPRLSYTNSGCAILALSSNAVHKLWIWEESDQNLTGRATTSVVPQLWQPPGGNLMTNDTCGANPEDAVPCFAVLGNSPFLISASGGEISLFDMRTFKTLQKFMPPPPPPPPNNGIIEIIEIGMEDSAIQIYSARADEIQRKVKGHWRIIKGFAFSTSLNVLVSSSADSQTLITFTPRPPPVTFLASFPQCVYDAIGREDSSIQIFDRRIRKWVAYLKGHQKRITGLAFSNLLNVLVSSGADSQLCVWNTGRWTKQTSKFLQMPNGRGAAPLADTRVQFHVDQIHLLVVHQTQIATCEAPKLECLKQWDTREASAPITDATYSCNGQSIYVSFEDGSINVLSASTLRLICCINLAAYILPKPSLKVYPLVIAAHPSEPNQFALGLTDGSVYVLEPLEAEGEWGDSPVENGAGPSTPSGATDSDQPQR